MEKLLIQEILAEWSDEFNVTLTNNNSLCVALFSDEIKLLFSTPAMSSLFKAEPQNSFINPTLDKLFSLKNSTSFIFEGYITIGSYDTINSSIFAKVFYKNNKLLIIGGVNTLQLIEQNAAMHQLNHEINNLQRQLLKEKHNLENTLIQLNEANNKLTELNITKDKFFSIIAHDLKNPFNLIIGFSELLKEKASKYNVEEVQQFSEIINNASKQSYALLENLLEWSKLQTGKLIPKIEQHKLNEIINDVIILCKPIAKSKNIELLAEIVSTEYILADKDMLKTILRNLVTNAIKFTNPEGSIKIETQTIESNILFTISDNGIGIASEYLEKLFAIDCKLSNKGTANEQGTGLGLILCKEFVEKQNGKIWVESELGKGSNFKFTIPLNQYE